MKRSSPTSKRTLKQTDSDNINERRSNTSSFSITYPTGYTPNSTTNATARQKGSAKSLAMTHKPLMREVNSVPPTSSLLELYNEQPPSKRDKEESKPFDTANVMDLTFNAREKTPDGSLVSLVCGNPASDMDSHRPADSDIDHIPTYSRQEERIDTVTKRDSPQKQYLMKSQSNDGRGSVHSLPPKANKSQISRQPNDPVIQELATSHTTSISQVNLAIANTRPRYMSVSAEHGTSLWAPLGISLFAWVGLALTAGCCVAVVRTSTLFLGFICGGFVVFVILRTYTWLLNPDLVFVYLPSISEEEEKLKDIPLVNLPRNTNESMEESVREFQGWLNLLEGQEYSPQDYHISNTEPVFMRLEGTSLRMKKPLESDIPKRAMWNEPVHNITFVKQIHIDLRSYDVELHPKDLPPSRVFNKRFPICLQHRKAAQDIGGADAESLFEKFNASHKKKAPPAIVLFCRTNKEKEEWYRRLDQASRGYPVTLMMLELLRLANQNQGNDFRQDNTTADDYSKHLRVHRRSMSEGSAPSMTSPKRMKEELFNRNHTDLLVDYVRYMMKLITQASKVDKIDTAKTVLDSTASPTREGRMLSPDRISLGNRSLRSRSPPDSNSTRKASSHNFDSNQPGRVLITDCDTGTLWVNALLQRLFFDFFREEYWRTKMKNKLQKKLDKINLPYYLGPLVIDQFNLGSSLPLLKRIGQPYMSDDGMWVDSELAYTGGAIMTLETKININAVKKDGNVSPPSSPRTSSSGQNANGTEENQEADSDDSSTDSDSAKIATPLDKDPKTGEHTVTRFFNRLKNSKYFQKLADTRLVKSALDKVSNTPLKLTVEIKYIAGIFSLNIAPPPTDRIWLGFRGPPELVITAKPVLGEKSVNLTKLSVWIEEKLAHQLQHEIVIPNMIDIRIPIMCGNYKTSHPPKLKSKKIRSSASYESRAV